MVNIRMIIPDGVLCLWPAWSVHNLTTQIPDAYYVAIERTRKITLPDYPEFQLIYQSAKLLEIGLTEKTVQGLTYLFLIWNVQCVMPSNTGIKSV